MPETIEEAVRRRYINGRRDDGLWPDMRAWSDMDWELALLVAKREAWRRSGGAAPRPGQGAADYNHEIALDAIRALRSDGWGVYWSRRQGESIDWRALGCFFDWWFWLSPAARAELRTDMEGGRPWRWARWAIEFMQPRCPAATAGDPAYSSTQALLASHDAWQIARMADDDVAPPGLKALTGRERSPWPLAIPDVPGGTPIAIPGLPIQPCAPFPGCLGDPWPEWVPTPCQPWPGCAWEYVMPAARATGASVLATRQGGVYDSSAELPPVGRPPEPAGPRPPPVSPITGPAGADDGRIPTAVAAQPEKRRTSWLVPVAIGVAGAAIGIGMAYAAAQDA